MSSITPHQKHVVWFWLGVIVAGEALVIWPAFVATMAIWFLGWLIVKALGG